MPNGNITLYTYSCVATNNTRNTSAITDSVSPSIMTVTVMELLPYTEYVCTVTASTSAGTSTPGTTTGVTGQGGI